MIHALDSRCFFKKAWSGPTWHLGSSHRGWRRKYKRAPESLVGPVFLMLSWPRMCLLILSLVLEFFFCCWCWVGQAFLGRWFSVFGPRVRCGVCALSLCGDCSSALTTSSGVSLGSLLVFVAYWLFFLVWDACIFPQLSCSLDWLIGVAVLLFWRPSVGSR